MSDLLVSEIQEVGQYLWTHQICSNHLLLCLVLVTVLQIGEH